MGTRIYAWVLTGIAFVLFVGLGVATAAEPPSTVTNVDLPRYMGTWYEIANIPNRFQRQCVADVTAIYAQRTDGRVDVTNRCGTASGEFDEAKGVARIVDVQTNAKLEVSFVQIFGWNFFWGDYWVLDLAPDYSTVIIGHPKRSYGWILSRTPTISARRRQELDKRLGELGYDARLFVTTVQTPKPAERSAQ